MISRALNSKFETKKEKSNSIDRSWCGKAERGEKKERNWNALVRNDLIKSKDSQAQSIVCVRLHNQMLATN